MKLPVKVMANLNARFLPSGTQYATPAQGAKADTALQPPDAAAFATSAQGALAAQAYAWGDHAAAGYQSALQVAVLEQQAASGTPGGAAAAVATRSLTVVSNTITGASASGSGVELPVGTYFVSAWAVAYAVGAHQCRVIVSGGTDLRGSTEVAPAGGSSASRAGGLLVLAAPAVVGLGHEMTTPVDANDGGYPGSFGIEVYAQLVIWRIA